MNHLSEHNSSRAAKLCIAEQIDWWNAGVLLRFVARQATRLMTVPTDPGELGKKPLTGFAPSR
jgi:hypothetical protein